MTSLSERGGDLGFRILGYDWPWVLSVRRGGDVAEHTRNTKTNEIKDDSSMRMIDRKLMIDNYGNPNTE